MPGEILSSTTISECCICAVYADAHLLLPFADAAEVMVRLWINCLDTMIGGEIFIPISRSYKLSNIMKIYNNKKYKIIGKKTGEKFHECLISEAEDMNIFYEKNLYILYREQKYKKLKPIKINLPFSSNDEKNIYTYSELKKILKR